MSKKENLSGSSALTEHINKARKQQHQVLHGFSYKYPPESTLSQLNSHLNVHTRTPLNSPSLTTTSDSPQEQTEINCTHIGIDKQASVVNGKLVVLRDQEQTLGSDNRQLMRLLRQNGISFKQYILGNKTKILEQIRASQEQKQEAVVKAYIRQHINREKTAKVEVAADFEANKANLFSSK